MVLDIRHLRDTGDDEEDERAEMAPVEASADIKTSANESAQSTGTSVEAVDAEPAIEAQATDEELEHLLEQAVEAETTEEQAEAIAQLRALVPSDSGVAMLRAVVEDKSDPRRLVAAQALGFHRHWLGAKSGEEKLVEWARKEQDPEVGAAMVWGLRNREVVQEFLLHRMIGMAREAALGLPVSEDTVPAIVTALMVGRAPDSDRVLLEKLSTVQRRHVGIVIEQLVQWPAPVSTDELIQIVASLPQTALFEIFLEKKGMPEWDPQQRDEDADRARNWHQLAHLAERQLLSEPGEELVRQLVKRSAQDDTFARRHAAFLRAAMQSTEAVFGTELVGDLERLTGGASEERLARMAEMLLELKDKLDGKSNDQAKALLEVWQSKSPELKLKIYHMQQGLR